MSRLKSLLFPFLIVIFISVSFLRLGSVKLFDVDEAVFSEATKEMVQSGDWITPTYNGLNRYDKPILFYWLMALSYKLFGINEFAARVPSAAAGILLCVCLFIFTKRVSGPERAVNASVALAASVYYFVYSHSAVTDMTLALFIMLSVFCFFISVSENGESSAGRRAHLGFYLFSSLAFLTKGLVGIVFPFAIAFIYLWITDGRGNMTRIFGRILSFRGALLFLAVSGPWYAAELRANGIEFIQQFFIKHHFVRYTGVISGHSGPVYYYIPVLIIGMMPWVAFLPQGIKTALKNSSVSLTAWRGRNSQESAGRPEVRHSADLLAVIWFSLIFLFFSFSTTKLPNYILGAVPAASILIASGMSAGSARSLRYPHIFIALLAAAACAAFLIAPRFLLKAGIADTGWTWAPALIMFALAAASSYTAYSGRTLYPFIAASMLAFVFTLSSTALPLAAEQLQGTLYKFSIYAKENLKAGDRIITYRLNKPSVVFYSDRKITNAGSMEELSSILSNNGSKENGPKLVIAKAGDLELLSAAGLVLIDKDRQYALLEKK